MLPQIRSITKALVHRKEMEDGMRDELAGHIEWYIEDLTAAGVPVDEARRRARLEFGAVDAIREECRESLGLRWPLEAARDLRYAARVLAKSPVFAFTATLTLALCIGANTAIFSVVDWIVLRPLPYAQPDRLATIRTVFRGKGMIDEDYAVSGRELEMLRESPALEVAAYAMRAGANLTIGTHAEYVPAQRVTAGYFHVLGAGAALGREFTAAEDRAGGPGAAILSYALWQRLFQGHTGALGQAIQVRGEPSTIVGVMPASFRPLEPASIWLPLRPSRGGEGADPNYRVVARLQPGAGWAEARAEVHRIGAAVARGMTLQPGESQEMSAVPMKDEVMEDVRSPLLVLWGSVIVVLIIGCVNIAGLLLVRGSARKREIGTRMALGSGRGAVVRQLLCESILLAAAGGIGGILTGYWGLEALKLLAGEHLDLAGVSLDGRVLLITACASILTGIAFGIAPALEASRVDVRQSLIEAGGRGVANPAHRWTRNGLVVAEVALGVVLLVAAGLLIRTLSYLRHLDPGFEAGNVFTATASLQDARYSNADAVNRLYDETLRDVRALPGVQAAAVALTLPYERPLHIGFRDVDGPHAGERPRMTDLTYVTPGYLEALRIGLIRGRGFTAADNRTSRPVAMVNEAFVRKYCAGRDPIGKHLAAGGSSREIVGVAGNVQLSESFGNFSAISVAPEILIPAAQSNDKQLQLLHTWFMPSWIVKTSGGQGMAGRIQHAIEGAAPQLPLASFRKMDEVVAQSLADRRFQAILLGALAALALLLAALGIYGLIASAVAERTRELGIRLALGATIGQAMRAVALPGIVLALAGASLGGVLARACAGVLRHLVYGVSDTDPATFVVAVGILVLAGAVASLIPALRVTRLNPADTLKAE